ncbi:MAG: tRNA (guanosine(46)-N7)-methyltransferase TrmB [Parvularculaceae bacterium]
MPDSAYIPRLYGRRQDKPLKPRQARLMHTLLPKVALPNPTESAIEPAALFPHTEDVWLEIGFGGGEHLAWQAEHNPRIGVVGAEPFINGVAKLLVQIEEKNLQNVRICHGDARPLLEALADASIGRLFVLHPDPWPKKRHFKRRLISPWFFAEAARVMKSGAELRIATDIPDYARWTLMHAQNAPDFEWIAERADDWRIRPPDWPQTRYEAKAVSEERAPVYLVFRRI